MADLTPSMFFLTLVLWVVLGAVFAAVGFAYHVGYFRKNNVPSAYFVGRDSVE